MKLPEDIRYANRIWMLMVLVSPFLLFERSENNVFTVYLGDDFIGNGGLYIIYWAIIFILVIWINGKDYTVISKKIAIQVVSSIVIIAYFLLVPERHFISSVFAYMTTTSFGIWYFKLENAHQRKELDVIDHLID